MTGLRSLARILTIRCEPVSDLISHQLDERLGVTDRLALEGHLIVCKSCRQLREQLRWLHDAAGRGASMSVLAPRSEETLSLEARERIQASIRESLEPRPDPSGDGGPPR